MHLLFSTITFIATPSPEKKIAYKTFFVFDNYWAFVVFSGPDLVANLSDGLKIMNPRFITSYDIGKLLFCHILETFEASFWPLLPVVCFAHQSTDVAAYLAKIFWSFKYWLKIS